MKNVLLPVGVTRMENPNPGDLLTIHAHHNRQAIAFKVD